MHGAPGIRPIGGEPPTGARPITTDGTMTTGTGAVLIGADITITTIHIIMVLVRGIMAEDSDLVTDSGTDRDLPTFVVRVAECAPEQRA